MKDTLRIGTGAGYSGDRIEPAEDLVRRGNLDYIVFECLAERTIALAQLSKIQNPKLGYDPLLVTRMERVLPLCYRNKTKLITNMGAANPVAAMEKTLEIARKHGLNGLKVAAVAGDDVSTILQELNPKILETGSLLQDTLSTWVSANAYLGADSILAALEAGADVVITGRVADPSLFLAPMVHEFKWDTNDWSMLGQGTVIGHLMECAGQVTGGYFADPGRKDIEQLGRLGFPLVEIKADGTAIVTKLADTGGTVSLDTCKEQMLYELGDPSAYITPDVMADFTAVRLSQTGPDRVEIKGGRGRQRTDSYKVSVGYHGGYIGEGEISYGGYNALNRAEAAAAVVAERLKITGAQCSEIRYDLIGYNSLYSDSGQTERKSDDAYREIRLRVAAKTETRDQAGLIGNEVETLYTNGPAGGGGARKAVREIIAVLSVLIPRDKVKFQVITEEV